MSRRVGEKRISLIDLSLRARQNDRYIEGYPLKLVVRSQQKKSEMKIDEEQAYKRTVQYTYRAKIRGVVGMCDSFTYDE